MSKPQQHKQPDEETEHTCTKQAPRGNLSRIIHHIVDRSMHLSARISSGISPEEVIDCLPQHLLRVFASIQNVQNEDDIETVSPQPLRQGLLSVARV